jgi:hypothetical protein
MAMDAIVQMCGRSQTAAMEIVALVRRKGVKNEARTLALRGGARMAVAAIEQMSGRSIEWHLS